jgi:hypothetical protein
MKRSLPVKVVLTALVSVLVSGCGSTETILTHQKETDVDIRIDGNLSDWPVSRANVHDSDHFSYYVMQDADYLYIYVDFKSPFYNGAIENSGFILYLSAQKNSRNHRGIGWPSGSFNMLRDNPDTFRSLTRDSGWFDNTGNRRLLESLREENFDHVMIVERFGEYVWVLEPTFRSNLPRVTDP